MAYRLCFGQTIGLNKTSCRTSQVNHSPPICSHTPHQTTRTLNPAQYSFLPHITLLKLASITISEDEEDQDSVAWLPSSQKKFTVKSAHALKASWSQQSELRGWKIILRLMTMERIKVIYMWQLAHSRLLTNEDILRQGLTLSANGGRCSGFVESCLRTIRDCEESVDGYIFFPQLSLKNSSLSPFETDYTGIWWVIISRTIIIIGRRNLLL